MEGAAAKPKGRKRQTKKQEAADKAASAAAAGAAAGTAAAAPTATDATATEQNTELEDVLPKPSLSQRLAKSLKQLSQLGAGSKSEEGDEVEQLLLQQPRGPAEAPADHEEAEGVQQQQQQQRRGNGLLGSAEDEEGEQGGTGRVAGTLAALARRLKAAVPRRWLPAGSRWPAAATVAALLLLLLLGWLAAASQAHARGRQLSTLQRQVSTQLQAAAAASEQLQQQLSDLQRSVQAMDGRLAASSSTLKQLQQSCSTQAGTAARLQAELTQARGDIDTLQQATEQLAETAAAAAAAVAASWAPTATANTTSGSSILAAEAADAAGAAAAAAAGSQHLIRQVVHEEVESALELFAADRTGLPDYALAAVGAAVVAHSSAHQPPPSARLPQLSKLRGHSASTVHPQANKLLLAPISQPGACLPLVGSSGYVDIRLAKRIHPTAFTYEHIPAAIAFDIRSAPRNLRLVGFLGPPPPPPLLAPAGTSANHSGDAGGGGSIGGLAGSTEGEGVQGADGSGSPASIDAAAAAAAAEAAAGGAMPLGSFSYDARAGRAVQTFQLTAPLDAVAQGLAVDHVRLVIASNHGHPDYTCLYRLRVHGTPAA